jgi:hypothetical protein
MILCLWNKSKTREYGDEISWHVDVDAGHPHRGIELHIS